MGRTARQTAHQLPLVSCTIRMPCGLQWQIRTAIGHHWIVGYAS